VKKKKICEKSLRYIQRVRKYLREQGMDEDSIPEYIKKYSKYISEMSHRSFSILLWELYVNKYDSKK